MSIEILDRIVALQRQFVEAVDRGSDTTRVLRDLEAVRVELKKANMSPQVETNQGLTTGESVRPGVGGVERMQT